jgi:hypothetical protein
MGGSRASSARFAAGSAGARISRRYVRAAARRIFRWSLKRCSLSASTFKPSSRAHLLDTTVGYANADCLIDHAFGLPQPNRVAPVLTTLLNSSRAPG